MQSSRAHTGFSRKGSAFNQANCVLWLQGEPYPMIYFAMQCIGPKVPALKYGYPAQVLEFATQLLRLNPIGYRLPDLDHYISDPGAVDNGVLFMYSPNDIPELRPKGFKISEVGGVGTLPAFPKLAVEPTVLVVSATPSKPASIRRLLLPVGPDTKRVCLISDNANFPKRMVEKGYH